MSERKRMPIAEFSRLGYLQEANRQFFHPHGLALEITRITDQVEDDGAKPPIHALALGASEYELLTQILADPDGELSASPTLDRLRRLVEQATGYEAGDAYLSSVWDSDDDPEGIVYGSWSETDREKVETVRERRLRYRAPRVEMFGADDCPDADVEPVGWLYPEP